MTRQTPAPLTRVPLNTYNRPGVSMVEEIDRGRIDLNPPYQRGDVWTEDQRVALVRSLLTGVPMPSLVLGERDLGSDVPYVVIDGKQRLTTVRMWLRGELAVPASWFPASEVESTTETDDGPYVTFSGLSRRGQAIASRFTLPCAEAQLRSIREEADLYTLVNGNGTPQTDEDMARAARVVGKD